MNEGRGNPTDAKPRYAAFFVVISSGLTKRRSAGRPRKPGCPTHRRQGSPRLGKPACISRRCYFLSASLLMRPIDRQARACKLSLLRINGESSILTGTTRLLTRGIWWGCCSIVIPGPAANLTLSFCQLTMTSALHVGNYEQLLHGRVGNMIACHPPSWCCWSRVEVEGRCSCIPAFTGSSSIIIRA